MNEINCAGIVIQKMSKKYGIKVKDMPDFVHQRYCTVAQLRNYLSQIGLVVTFSTTKTGSSFFFDDLKKHNITMLISYEGINGDASKHVEIVEQMDVKNRIKLHHIERWLNQDDFDIKLYTFVSDKDISGIVDFF